MLFLSIISPSMLPSQYYFNNTISLCRMVGSMSEWEKSATQEKKNLLLWAIEKKNLQLLFFLLW